MTTAMKLETNKEQCYKEPIAIASTWSINPRPCAALNPRQCTALKRLKCGWGEALGPSRLAVWSNLETYRDFRVTDFRVTGDGGLLDASKST